MHVLQSLAKPFFVLAPMDDVTDTVFRQVIAGCARPDLFFTEFTNVDGLQSAGRERVARKLKQASAGESTGSGGAAPDLGSGSVTIDRPLIAHLWGKSPENFYKTAREIAGGQWGEFAGIDLNMGCPDKTVVKNGACSALINDRPLAHDIIRAVQAGVADGTSAAPASAVLPVSVKTRLGFGGVDYGWHQFLLGHDLAMLTVHGRTRAQMSKVPADWQAIGRVRQLRDQLAPTTLMVGNGDVTSRRQGLELAAAYKLDGIMIGRGVFRDPFAFAVDSPWPDYTRQQRLELYRRQVALFQKTWQPGERAVPTLNKFCKIYVNGFDGAKELREELMAAKSADELQQRLQAALAAPKV